MLPLPCARTLCGCASHLKGFDWSIIYASPSGKSIAGLVAAAPVCWAKCCHVSLCSKLQHFHVSVCTLQCFHCLVRWCMCASGHICSCSCCCLNCSETHAHPCCRCLQCLQLLVQLLHQCLPQCLLRGIVCRFQCCLVAAALLCVRCDLPLQICQLGCELSGVITVYVIACKGQ